MRSHFCKHDSITVWILGWACVFGLSSDNPHPKTSQCETSLLELSATFTHILVASTFLVGKIVVDANMVSDQCLQTKAEVVSFYIDGSEAASSEGVTIPVYSAKDQKIVHMAQSASIEDVKAAVDSAKRAFDSWRWTSAYERRDLLLKAADAFEARLDQAIALQVAEISCETSWAGFNVKYGIRFIREIACRTTAIFGQMPLMNSESDLVLVFKEPIGPSLLIAPLVERQWTH